jgi:CheY-like chemotaxis protein
MGSSTKPAVLVVEDNPHIRALAVDMIESLGLIAYDAYRGEDALQLLAEHPEITALFADVKMPGMGGIELAEAARRIRPGLRVVMTSGYIAEDSAPREADVFVAKPYRLAHLRTIFSAEIGAPAERGARQ